MRSALLVTALLPAASLLAACGSSGPSVPSVPNGLRHAFSDAVDQGRHLKVPSLGDVGLDKVDSAAAQRELAGLVGLVPDAMHEQVEPVLAVACHAEQMYEDGTAATQDEAVSRALAQATDLPVSAALVSTIESRLVRDVRSNNPVLSVAAVFACRWAAG